MSTLLTMQQAVIEHRRKKRQAIQQRLEFCALADHIQELIRQPDPIIGWEGNPWFTVVRHELTDDIEIWFERPGYDPQMVSRAKSDPPPDLRRLLEGLMEWGDNARTPMGEKLAKIDKHNDAILDARRKRLDDELDEAKDRLELAVVKDIQGMRGRLY